MYKNIIFDADGTLLDTLPGIYEGFNLVMKKLNRPALSHDAIKPFIGPSLVETFTTRLSFSPEETTAAVGYYRDFYWERGYRMCEFFPGILELLKKMKADGKILCIATNKPQPFIDLILKQWNVADYFTVVAGAELTESSTDKTSLVRRAICDKSAVMVGDRYVDIAAAKSAGIDSIGVLWGTAEDGEFVKYPPTHIAKDVKELYSLVK